MAKKTRRRAATKSTAPARARNESSRQRFLLSPEELDRRLALLDQVDELKARSEEEQGYGYFLKALREKFHGESVEGLRQLRVARDRLGVGRFRRLVRRLGFKRTLVLATLPDDKRQDLIEHGFPAGKGKYRDLEEVSLRELEDLARRSRKRTAEAYPGPPITWPEGLVRLLKPLARAWPRIEASRESSLRKVPPRDLGQREAARMKKDLARFLAMLKKVVVLVRKSIEELDEVVQPTRRTGKRPTRG